MDGFITYFSFHKLSASQSSFLECPFTLDEVHHAVWNCDSIKAPGPDGLNFLFYKRSWSVLHAYIFSLVNEFFHSGKIFTTFKTSFITLVPKKVNPMRLKDFCPISLIHGIYKIIIKLLANRSKGVLDCPVGKSHMAFISGR